jgi:hypothetical protein
VTRNGAVFFISPALPAGTGAVPNGRSLNVFVSERGSGGWSTSDLTPFATEGNENLVAGAPDGKSALVFTEASLAADDLDNPLGVTAPQGGFRVALDLYLVGEATSPQLVSHGALPRTAFSEEASEHHEVGPPYVFNAQLSAVGFTTSHVPLDSAASEAAKSDCYSWSDVGARAAMLTNPDKPSLTSNCELLGMTPDGRAIFKDTSGDSYSGEIFVDSVGLKEGLTFPGGSTPAVQLSAPFSTPTTFDALSPDGKLAYVTTAYPLGGEERGSEPDVYAVTVPAFPHNTVEVPGTAGFENTVVCLSCQVGGGGAATFMGQSADGSHVLFEIAAAAGEPAGHPYEGLWSWDRNSKTAARLTEATDVKQLVFSENGQYAVGLTRQLAKNPEGTADVYEFTASQAPQLITSGISADVYQLTGEHGSASSPPTAGGVSDDGRRVVYDEQPPAVKGQLPPETAQEWTSDETVQLSPLGAGSSYYVLGTAGPELEDVFFAAYAPLVPADRNAGTQDVYDVRAGGGFPAPTEPADNSQTPNPVAPPTPAYTGNLTSPGLQLGPLPADTSHSASTSTAKPLTRAQKLAKALKACKKDKSKSKRLACEKGAQKKYGAKSKPKKTVGGGK